MCLFCGKVNPGEGESLKLGGGERRSKRNELARGLFIYGTGCVTALKQTRKKSGRSDNVCLYLLFPVASSESATRTVPISGRRLREQKFVARVFSRVRPEGNFACKHTRESLSNLRNLASDSLRNPGYVFCFFLFSVYRRICSCGTACTGVILMAFCPAKDFGKPLFSSLASGVLRTSVDGAISQILYPG